MSSSSATSTNRDSAALSSLLASFSAYLESDGEYYQAKRSAKVRVVGRSPFLGGASSSYSSSFSSSSTSSSSRLSLGPPPPPPDVGGVGGGGRPSPIVSSSSSAVQSRPRAVSSAGRRPPTATTGGGPSNSTLVSTLAPSSSAAKGGLVGSSNGGGGGGSSAERNSAAGPSFVSAASSPSTTTDVTSLTRRAVLELGVRDKLRNGVFKRATSSGLALALRFPQTAADAPPSSDRHSETKDGGRSLLHPRLHSREDGVVVFTSGAVPDGRQQQRQSDCLPAVGDASLRWNRSINDEIRAVARERGDAIARREDGGGSATSGADDKPSAKKIRFIFDTEDLLDAVKRIECNNSNSSFSPNCGLIKLVVSTPTFAALRHRFAELHPSNFHIGLDDTLNDSTRFIHHRQLVGQRVLAENYIPVTRQYAKFGVPASLRPQMYRCALGLSPEVSPAEVDYYRSLLRRVDGLKFPVEDDLNRMDLGYITNDFTFFPFSELLLGVVMAFSRDPWILDNAAFVTHEPLVHEFADGSSVRVPSSGVHPFKGFCKYAAPLALIYQDAASVYATMRAMYAQYWCRLNVLHSDASTLVSLCKTFEDLLMCVCPALFLHLNALECPPLSIAFSWLHLGFVGYLEVEQVLLLWDRVLAFDDLSIVAVLAASVFVFRQEVLLCAANAEQAKAAFSDLGARLKVVTLLQAFLFPEALKR